MPPDLTTRDLPQLRPGVHRVARNLYIHHKPPTKASWVMIYSSPATGKRAEMGLGSVEVVSLATAKATVLRHRLAILAGDCPLQQKRQATQARRGRIAPPGFRAVADLYIAAHSGGWKDAKSEQAWRNSLTMHAFPVLGDLPVGQVTTGDVMQVLEPLWHQRTETASRVRQRIEAVLDYAAARGWRAGENPARWRGHIANLLPRPAKLAPTKHHAALPWQELPALWDDLRGLDALPARGLQFAMLTACRTAEVLEAKWAEFDRVAGIWTIPAERMKGGREHRVPLSDAALALLGELAAVRQEGGWLFPGAKRGRPIRLDAMQQLLRPRGTTVHGTTRSGFRDWASEHAVNGEVAEQALAHTITDKTEAAYRRGDLLEPRRAVMQRWADFLTGAKQ